MTNLALTLAEATAMYPDELMVLAGWSTSGLNQPCLPSF